MNRLFLQPGYCTSTAAEEVGDPLLFVIAEYLSSPDLDGFYIGVRRLWPVAEGLRGWLFPDKWEEESGAVLSSGGRTVTPGCPPLYSHFSMWFHC